MMFLRLPRRGLSIFLTVVLLGLDVAGFHGAAGGTLTASFTRLAAGQVVDLSGEGQIDWVHWGLYTETSLDRKRNVVPQISDFTLLDSAAGFAFAFQYSDNATGYSWNDGTPTAAVTNTTTGVWAYGTPQNGSGFQITAPADTATRTLKLYVGAFGARGRFEASLSDGSARSYSDLSLSNALGGPGGVYTITYAAGSPGQHLTLRWALQFPLRPDGNVTLQAAALTSSTANNPPFVALTAPTDNADFSASSTITLEAFANDLDGTVTNVQFFSDDTLLGEADTSPYRFSWNDVPAGFYTLTAVATDNAGAGSVSSPVEVFVHGSGGSLTGALVTPTRLPTFVDLTREGTADWAHWGLATNSPFDHKVGVVQQISDFIPLGTNAVERYADNYTAFGWSDGEPTRTEGGTTTGAFITGATSGFELAVLADTVPHTVTIYAGLYGAQGNFQAWLSDFSAPAYRDTTLSNVSANAYGAYTLTFAAASPGQYLIIRYRALNVFDRHFGNVTLQAASLSGAAVANLLPSVAVISPTNGTVLTAPASFPFSAEALDADGSVAQVEFFNAAASLGVDTTSSYSVLVTNLGAGTYTLSAVATDNSGGKATNRVTVTVVGGPLSPVTLVSPGWVGSDFIFSFASLAGQSYEVQSFDLLGGGVWQPLGLLPGNGGTLTVTNHNPSGAQRFFRVETK